MPDGFNGSAVVSADQPIKAIVNVTNRESGGLGVAGGQAAAQYQGIDGVAVDTTLYFPMAKNNRYGKTTSFYIQNAGSTAATATCVFTMDDSTPYNYTTPPIGPGQMVVVTPADALVPATGTNRNNIGSLKVTSSQPLAGVVMEYNTGESPATLLQGTRGFTANDFDTAVFAPTVSRIALVGLRVFRSRMWALPRSTLRAPLVGLVVLVQDSRTMSECSTGWPQVLRIPSTRSPDKMAR